MPEKKRRALKENAALREVFFVAILVLVIAVVFVFFHIITGANFLTVQNLRVVFSHCVIPTLIAMGLCFLFATGYTDMSIGAVMILVSNCAGETVVRFGYAPMLIVSVVVSFALIFLNIQVSNKLKLPSWLSGIGMAMVYEAVMGYYSNVKVNGGSTVISLGKSFRELGSMPTMLIIAIAGVIVAWVIFTRTMPGVNIRALGSNRQVSKMMGINDKRVMLMTAVIAAVFIGVASAINISYSGKQLSSSGLTSISLIFEPLAILLLARAFEQKIAMPIGIFLCSILIAGLFNALTWLGVPSGTGQEVIMGCGIVVCAIFAVRGTKGVVK